MPHRNAAPPQVQVLRHTPTLYPHAEDDTEGRLTENWTTSLRPSVPPTTQFSLSNVGLYPQSTMPVGSSAAEIAATIPVYSDIYPKFVKRFRDPGSSDDYARYDPDSHYFQRGLGQLVDAGDSEEEDISRGISGMDIREKFSPTPEPETLDKVTPQERERLEWQIMLTSVLDGDVLRSEKKRIVGALDASVEHNRQLDIWLGIRARLRRRTESEEKKRLIERRMRVIDPLVSDILLFRFDNSNDSLDPSQSQDEAAKRVEAILSRLEIAQSLYPSLKAMYADKPNTIDHEFQTRCNALISWYNINTRLNLQISVLQKWTGSETLDVTQHSAPAETNFYPTFSPSGPSDHTDATTFVERVLKEVSLQAAFEKGSLTTIHSLISQSRATLINHSFMFRTMNLPGFEKELVQIASFPSKLMEACLHVRLDYAAKVKDPEVLIIDQLLDDFKISIALACTVKKEYQWLLAPVTESNWNLPPCIPPTYDEAILDALRFFFKLIHWKLKSGTKGIYFKETDVLEAQSVLFSEVSTTTDEGSLLVAEQLWQVFIRLYKRLDSIVVFSSLTNRLMIRVTDYFETQLRVPSVGKNENANPEPDVPIRVETALAGNSHRTMSDEQMVSWFGKVLDSVRLRSRKLQRYVRVLSQRYSNSAEYNLESVNLNMFIETLVATDHALVYTECFEEQGIYLIASSALRERPDLIRRMLQRAYISASDLKIRASHNGWPVKAEDFSTETFDEDESIGYILLLSPQTEFVWQGAVLMIEVPPIDFELKEQRIRLIADGGHNRLVKAKQLLVDLFAISDGDGSEAMESPLGILRTVTDQQAHLPSINRELRKIMRATNRLAEGIVNSVHHVRRALTSVERCQELLENWYSFASEHGQHVQKHMDRATWIRFNRLLTRLAISWVSFICDDCDPTDRKTFRWAVMALEFTLLRTRHNNILHLPEDQFRLLRQKVASCMNLLMAHFDILGARSSFEAKKERERQEALQRQERLESNAGEDEPCILFAEENRVIRGSQFVTTRSVRLFWEQTIRSLRELQRQRAEVESSHPTVGRVLDNEKPEDRSLVFLASAGSHISIRWQQGRFIGAGAFGSVYLAANMDTGSLMAVKEIRYQDVSPLPNLVSQIREELRIMEMLQHPNVVEYYGIEVHRDKVYIFEEFCQNGSLAALLEQGRIEDEGIMQVYTMQMLDGLAYLHSKGIVHRDVKPDSESYFLFAQIKLLNILLDHRGVIKFVDFGAAKILAKNQRTLQRSRIAPGMGNGIPNNSLTGTPMYMSPEVIKNDKRGRHGAMDIWSLGCVVLEFATGRKPWSNLDNEWAIMFHIGVATQHPPLPEPDQLSELGINFIKQCLTIDPMRRPTAVELMSHPWMVTFREALDEYEDEAVGTNKAGDPGYVRPTVAKQTNLSQE
ncbi:hypothetical protein Clacol_003786 [Clathrus columnatus]|uniref:Protein kinase domain-containing protein n=1 Tax=Clathrus columnatus TaxID=1419009 RepID=A0AAV5A8P9_9AGAM|nr:hypothetical protein Clacol_003786 [Clathrus columnatus]